ncbi:hypothetical protein [Niallia taxi]|uniref:hypothetical protein n=1 Tax=Niallia taxi TaxID=2499688 RepID=UPI0015F382A3|nr:hypothetical protein [Niallia taxi]
MNIDEQNQNDSKPEELQQPNQRKITEEHIQMAYGHQIPANVAEDYFERHMSPFLWAWYEKPYNTVLFIGGDEKDKRGAIDRFCELKHSFDNKSVYRTHFSNEKPEGKEFFIGALYDYERIPDFINIDDAKILNEARTFFVSSYFTLLSKEKGVPRDELVNRASYSPDKEGPLVGYFRKAEESIHVEWLKERLQYFGQGIWHNTPKGSLRHISNTATKEEKAALLFETIWEMHYLYLGLADAAEPRPVVYVIDIPNEVLEDELTKGLILKALQYLLWDAEVADITLIINIEKPNEVSELPISQHVLFDSEQAFSYRAMSDIPIENEEFKVLDDKTPGVCLWLNKEDGQKFALRLYTQIPHAFINPEQG